MELECLAQVQVVPRRRRKADQVVDQISLGDVIDSEGVEISALMRFHLQTGRRKTQVQFVVLSHHQPICAVPGTGAQRQAVQLRIVDPEEYDHDFELLKFVV